MPGRSPHVAKSSGRARVLPPLRLEGRIARAILHLRLDVAAQVSEHRPCRDRHLGRADRLVDRAREALPTDC